ncbi:conserved hypothetical protein [Methylocella silvestris BL2]|uniref:Flagellar assembly protein FliH/Type III secretion system HrpE domain-containing protein n=1 Tax=Methylocella silvestris (strain DSM 15510 / CIP 108128 / LMG 27833 / NCIMB 13906 / BL2) TaxID=395965 RepID=B8EL24_METSB|nr:hypothetical protein [Methylocella silvestris]ACK49019.1 conserved hypothetical protein [Methylocella silvestris BL2]
MTPRPVSHYLICFDASVQPSLESEVAPEPRAAPTAVLTDNHTESARLVWEQGREEGYAAGFVDARREGEETLQALKLALAQQMGREREAWVKSEGAAFGGKIEAMLAHFEERVGASVAQVLRPLLAGPIRDKAVCELIDCIRLMLGRDQPLIAISGRADFLGAIKLRLGEAAASVAFAANDECDIRIVADQTLIESRIRSWAEALSFSSE